MQYQVPQFIEVEDKIVGPLSIRQFLYLAGGAGAIYLSFSVLPVYLGIFPAALIGGLGVCLAFVKINNRPFMSLVEAAFHYALETRLYVWKRIEKKDALAIEIAMNMPKKTNGPVPMAHVVGSSLSSLAWQIDTHDKDELKAERGG